MAHVGLFSTIEEIESALAFKTGKVPSPLSVEQVLVCCGNNITTCSGCMGGDTVVAYEYLMDRSKGLDYDSDYPYDPIQTLLIRRNVKRPSIKQLLR